MNHADFMRHALKLARKGRTSPNPMVGAVIVRSGTIVGEGYHQRAGAPHAEVEAIRKAGNNAVGADLYVTLEPCSHTGRTPPCTDAIIAAGIRRVFTAMVDPDARVSGQGIAALRAAGIEVTCGICEREALELNASYVKHRSTGLPLVTLKLAMSLDGKIATRMGHSQWITGESARKLAHRLRASADAVMVGAGTVRADNPRLTARIGRTQRYPLRVIVAGVQAVPADIAALKEPGKTLVAVPRGADSAALSPLRAAGAEVLELPAENGRVRLSALMCELGSREVLSVLIEGGSELAGSAVDERIVDRVVFFYAPIIIGGREATPGVGGTGAEHLSGSTRMEVEKTRRLGADLVIEGRLIYPE